MSGERDFLSRWSARKGEARKATEEPAPEVAPPTEPAPEPAFTPEELETLSDAELCQRLELPDPETMAMGDDFKVFLHDRVPERLRRVALRRLWRSNPTLACLDGLNDYDEDYTGTGAPAGVVKTLYRVGMGFAAPKGEADLKVAEAVDTAESGDIKNAALQTGCAPKGDSHASAADPDSPETSEQGPEICATAEERRCDGPSQIKSRRMSFRFVEKPNPEK